MSSTFLIFSKELCYLMLIGLQKTRSMQYQRTLRSKFVKEKDEPESTMETHALAEAMAEYNQKLPPFIDIQASADIQPDDMRLIYLPVKQANDLI